MEELEGAVETFKPQLILMDHEMKGICGDQLIRFLKSSLKYAAIPVIYFSSREDIIELTKPDGTDRYFKKPFDVDNLIALAKKHLTHP